MHRRRSATAATTCSSAPARVARLAGAAARRRPARSRWCTQAGIPLGAIDALDRSSALLADGATVTRIEIGAGETAKSLTTIEHVTRALAAAGVTRHDVVVGVGGGMVTDVAGFAAAVWHRGIPVVHVATTLLGMVDAAIGGKTGVNLPEGKNLVGAFWQPSGVICDLDALATLPPRERRSGDGEMAKYHFLTGEDLERAAAGRPGRPLRRDQGRGRGERRARGRPPSAAQLRPHAGARRRDRHRPRRHPRRGGRHRPGVRRRTGRTTSGGSTPDRVAEHRRVVGGPLRPADVAAAGARPERSARADGAGTRRRSTG